jgi:hypothetical protein
MKCFERKMTAVWIADMELMIRHSISESFARRTSISNRDGIWNGKKTEMKTH